MKIAILSGSVREGRRSILLARYLQQELNERKVQTTLLDLAAQPLPVYGQKAADHSNVDDIGNVLAESDAIILVTPEYHGSFSGVLKNALDHYWSEFNRKPVGVAAASSGRMGGINASSQLQHVVLSLGAYALPVKLLVSEIHEAFNSTLHPRSERVAPAARKFLDELLWLTEALSRKKAQEAWQTHMLAQ